MASRELIFRVGARREGVGDRHRFLSRVWVSSRVLVEREGRGGCCRCISYHGREGVYISTAPHVEVISRGLYRQRRDIHIHGKIMLSGRGYRYPLVLKFLLSPFLSFFFSSSFSSSPSRKENKEKEEKRKKEEGRRRGKKKRRRRKE